MTTRVGIVLSCFFSLISQVEADPAKVSYSVNEVVHGKQNVSQAAPVGTLVEDGEYVKTGNISRAELAFSNQTITRLGANTIFNYDSSAYHLESGTMLFAKPKDGKTYEVKTGSVTAAILGSVAQFFYNPATHNSVVLNEGGTVSIIILGKSYPLSPGEGVSYTPGKAPYFFYFNLQHQIDTSALLTAFPPLSFYNQSELKRGLRDFHTTAPLLPDNAIGSLNQIQNPIISTNPIVIPLPSPHIPFSPFPPPIPTGPHSPPSNPDS